jgi:hypothetical protein
MSTLLEQASLVMIPSGYKEDVVYSQIPTNGNGDLSFTRASNGTRVNNAGLVEVCPWNLLQYSEDFTNTSIWTQDAAGTGTISVTANYGVAPNGTTTADRVQMTKGSIYTQIYQTMTVISGGQYTLSVYLKSLSGTPTITTLYNTAVAGTKTLTTEWVRYDFTFIAASSTIYPMIALYGSDSASMDVLAWGYQLNIGSTAKPYFPTTDRLNVPRLTYQNGGGGCPSLLLEKQSTNLCTYSEDLSNGVYTQSNVSVTANTTTSPDGTSNADTITSSAASPQLISPAVSFASSTNVSLFVKYVSQKYVQLFSGGAFGDYVNFDIESGAVGSNGGTTTNAQIQSFGNGWYRVSATFGGYTGATTGRIGFVDSLSAGWNALTSTTSKSIYAWGFQIEASSYPTSYIPTTSSSATRVADACSKTGISSLIGQTEGVVFWDINVDILSATGNESILNIDNGAGFGETIYFSKGSNGLLYAEVYVGATVQCSFTYSLPSVGRYKMALAYKANDFAFYVNGVSRGTDSSGSVPTCSRLQMGQTALGSSDGKTNQAVLFPTRLTNAELASLTTI